MSYEKAMRHRVQKSRKQANNHFGFSTLAKNERRKHPVLGGAWFEPGQEAEREAFIAQWHVTTANMLKLDPSLKIVD